MSFPTVPLKSVALVNPETLGEDTSPSRTYSYAEISDVTLGESIRWQEPTAFASLPSRARRVVRDDDVVVSTVRTYLRAVARVVRAPKPALVSTGFAVFRPIRVEPRFLGYSLQATHFVDAVVADSVGVSYPAVNASDVARLHVSAPPLETQRQIADYLDHETAEIDAFVSDQKRLAVLVDERLAARNESVFESATSSTPLRRLIGNMVAGTSVNATDTIRTGSEPAVLKTSAVYGGIFDPHALKVVWEEEIARLTTLARPGHLVVSRMNTAQLVGDAAIVPSGLSNVYLPDRLWQVEPRVDARFLYAWTRTRRYREQVAALAVGASPSMKTLAREDFLSLRVPTLPAEQQVSAGVAYVKDLAKRRAIATDIETALTLAKERRAALITAAVIGQIDVRARRQPVIDSIQRSLVEAR
ncbi:restriction endonuclease subunit S [Microbacterium sp. NPDC058345]|uniref:restriction endonuclease subunit S n=1 Tax=Microbacterium sp. NPDC058345 TaxID=3346455 RepID=UPI003647C4FF